MHGNQTQIKVIYIFIPQQNLIHTVKVIKRQPKNTDSEIMKLYPQKIPMSNVFRREFLNQKLSKKLSDITIIDKLIL